MQVDPLVTVLVPTHSNHETLEHSVRSILGQSVGDLAVVIIGDGATAEVTDVAEGLRRLDPRVRFEAHPKTPRRGELIRDRIIRDSSSRFIAYNCDDDLWMPDHLETMIGVLGERDFVHPLSILIDADGVPVFFPSDLERPESIAWHLTDYPRNSISLSGVLHTRASYLRLPHGWRETPEGRWTDHWMWRQFFEQPWFRGTTSPRSTTLKLDGISRGEQPPGLRRAEIERWWERMHAPGFAREWDEMVADAVRRAAVTHNVAAAVLQDEVWMLSSRLHETGLALAESRESERKLRVKLRREREQLRATRESLSWRITAPLRALRRLRRR